jgi:hypothetical protein
MQANRRIGHNVGAGKLQKNAAHLLDFLVFIEKMLVAEKITETEFSSFGFGLIPGTKGTVLRPQLLGRIACHPKRFLIRHRRPAQGVWSGFISDHPAAR